MVFSGYMPHSGVSGSHGSFIFSFLKNLDTVLPSHCISLHSHQQWQRVPFSPDPLQHLLFVDFLRIVILTSAVLICCLFLLFSLQVRFNSFATPWAVAHQAPLSMVFSRQKDWNGLPFPSPGDILGLGTKPRSPALQVDSLPLTHQGSPRHFTKAFNCFVT